MTHIQLINRIYDYELSEGVGDDVPITDFHFNDEELDAFGKAQEHGYVIYNHKTGMLRLTRKAIGVILMHI